MPLCTLYVTANCNRLTSSPSGDTILCGVLPKTDRPKSLDLSGGPGSVRLPVPQLGSARQHHLASDRLYGVEEEEKETDQQKCHTETSVSCSAGTARRTGSETRFDPPSLMTTETVHECEEDSSSATTRHNLPEENEMPANNASSPSMDLQKPSSPLPHSASFPHASPPPCTLLRSNSHLPMPSKPKDRLKPSPSLPLGKRDRERPSSLVSPSSPTPSASSFSMDSLFTPTLDIFKSSVISAGKGVAEKASRFYSRLSSQTSLTQVGSSTFSP